jgi:hypothetical protein
MSKLPRAAGVGRAAPTRKTHLLAIWWTTTDLPRQVFVESGRHALLDSSSCGLKGGGFERYLRAQQGRVSVAAPDFRGTRQAVRTFRQGKTAVSVVVLCAGPTVIRTLGNVVSRVDCGLARDRNPCCDDEGHHGRYRDDRHCTSDAEPSGVGEAADCEWDDECRGTVADEQGPEPGADGPGSEGGGIGQLW